MPKTLFYSGLIVCGVIALLAGSEAIQSMQQSQSAGPRFGAVLAFDQRYLLLLAFVGMIAVGSIFLRMASLVAPRNLFAAFSAALSVGSVIVALTFITASQFQLSPDVLASGMLEVAPAMPGSGNTVAALLFAVLLFTLRPYFQVQASRMLSLLATLAGISLLSMLSLDLLAVETGTRELLFDFSSTSFQTLLALFFASTAVHCLRHRHLFTEVTNLRELLDVPIGKQSAPPVESVGFGSGVAFDS